jgi:hypothetical protein
MLLSNYSVLNRNNDRLLGNQFTNPMAQFKATLLNRFYQGEHVITGETDKSAFNNGYAVTEDGGYAWWLSPKAGGLSARLFDGSGTIVSDANIGLNSDVAFSGTGDITGAQVALIVLVSAAFSGSGSVSSSLDAFMGMSTALSGSGAISTSGTAISGLSFAVSGSGSLAGSGTAVSDLAIQITVSGDMLTTSNVGDAVWLQRSEGTYTYAEVMQIIAAVAAGKTTNSGQTFRDLSDTKDRVIGTVTGGDRTDVSYDLD